MPDRPARILLVDDEQPIQTLLSFPLQRDGYEVVQASDGREAISISRRPSTDSGGSPGNLDVITETACPRRTGRQWRTPVRIRYWDPISLRG